MSPKIKFKALNMIYETSCDLAPTTFSLTTLPEPHCFCSFLWEPATQPFQSPGTCCSSLPSLHCLSVKSLPHTSQTEIGHLDIHFHVILHFPFLTHVTQNYLFKVYLSHSTGRSKEVRIKFELFIILSFLTLYLLLTLWQSSKNPNN